MSIIVTTATAKLPIANDPTKGGGPGLKKHTTLDLMKRLECDWRWWLNRRHVSWMFRRLLGFGFVAELM